ncbi:uncharacterized protein F5Z01DRAFT_661559 [Emericellopsis atlantica]|uniref:Uncharacterized protein n=1 Tax=Emericellopsis atlantica TaxID=2614577 RepID=A0A9P7ZHR3_9HYPO|nr:uncharacterized protein F5Z01DRAFT_661559 [Emericellopsis atlantica]KAG9252338.1 hypothetical protein F5Z01DRAFT_661559 [Emericellopsis atlantica]
MSKRLLRPVHGLHLAVPSSASSVHQLKYTSNSLRGNAVQQIIKHVCDCTVDFIGIHDDTMYLVARGRIRSD